MDIKYNEKDGNISCDCGGTMTLLVNNLDLENDQTRLECNQCHKVLYIAKPIYNTDTRRMIGAI